MVAEHAFQHRGARARHADDEDRLGAAVVFGAIGRGEDPVGREPRHGRVLGAVGQRVVAQPPPHHRVALTQRFPGTVEIAQVLQFLVQREPQCRRVLAVGRHRPQLPAQCVDMVFAGVPAAQARARQRGAAMARAQLQAARQRLPGRLQLTVELQLHAEEVVEVGVVETGRGGAPHQPQRLGVQAQRLQHVGQRRQGGRIVAARHAGLPHQRGHGFAVAHPQQRLRHPQQ